MIKDSFHHCGIVGHGPTRTRETLHSRLRLHLVSPQTDTQLEDSSDDDDVSICDDDDGEL